MNSKLSRIFAACAVIILFSTGRGLAQTNASHKVKAGETLFSIAKKNGVSIQQIKKWNNLSGNQLSVGQTLTIKKQLESSSKSGITHIVKPHETLYSLSKKYHVTIAEIKKWNDLQRQNLAVGDKMQIHPGNVSSKSHRSGRSKYTVKSGDSLFRIAHTHNMSVARLKEMNNLSSNNLQVGQKLVLEPTDRPPSLAVAGVESSSQGKFIRYTLKQSQSMQRLLGKFNMDTTEFSALNPGIHTASLHKGEEVNLLAPANKIFKNPYQADDAMNSLGSTKATKYQPDANVTPTTSGELYNPDALTAANADIALGSVIFVQNSQNKQGVFVRINDRTTQKGLKLSDAAWQALALNGPSAHVTMYRSNE